MKDAVVFPCGDSVRQMAAARLLKVHDNDDLMEEVQNGSESKTDE